MTAENWLLSLALGAFAGAVGQLVRMIAGVAKASRTGQPADKAATPPATLLVGIFVGAAAGALAAVTILSDPQSLTKVDGKTILALIASGYAGTDFIEGFAGRYFPTQPCGPDASTSAQGPQAASSAQIDADAKG